MGFRSRRMGCAEFKQSLRLDRRGFLTAGLLGTAGLSLPALLKHEAYAAPETAARRPSVIILWMRGGPAHLDMWDPKPHAPEEIRGEFGVSQTKVPGIILSDELPLSAAAMDKWSLVRSLHHTEFADHASGDQMCFTGYVSGPNPLQNVMPSCGSIVARQFGPLNPELPAYVMIPKQLPGAGSAYLGAANAPFETGVDPATPGPFVLPDFSLSEGLTVHRLAERSRLMAGFDRMARQVDTKGQMGSMDTFNQQALGILTSSAARNAFDLDQEPTNIRERYGFMPRFMSRVRAGGDSPAWSQRILLARRLVEAGVRLVKVDVRWWDTHEDNFWSLRNGFLPRWDKAFTALLEDLEQRGLMSSTLVVAWGEFGRTPRVNAAAGRDHYPNAFSAALAGGPVQGGRVVGASDSHGAFPKTNPKNPRDVLATIYRHLGVDTAQQYVDHAGRPHPVLPNGTPIHELF